MQITSSANFDYTSYFTAPQARSRSSAPEPQTPPNQNSQADTDAEKLPDLRRELNRKKAELTQLQQQDLQQFKDRDAKVRAHEAAHLAASGGFAQGGASYTYQTGPDGRQYAIGGEVHIDVSPVAGDPEATLRKAQTIQRAALAPGSPSAQDHAVAVAASRMAEEARQELARQQTAELREPAGISQTRTQRALNAFSNPQDTPQQLDQFA